MMCDCGIPDQSHLVFDLKDLIMVTKKIPNSNNIKSY